MITLYIYENTNILMDTVSHKVLLSYCESFLLYGFDMDHTCYPLWYLLNFFIEKPWLCWRYFVFQNQTFLLEENLRNIPQAIHFHVVVVV